MTRPFAFLKRCAEECGDAFTLDLGAYGRFVFFSNPASIRSIFTADVTQLHAGEGNRVLRPFLGENSLLLLEEQRHLSERRLLLPTFHGRRIAQSGHAIRELTLAHIKGWGPGTQVNVHESMQEISLDAILCVVFGMDQGARFDALKVALKAFLTDAKFNLALIGLLSETGTQQHESWVAFRQIFDRINQLIAAELQDRRQNPHPDGSDVLTMLLAATREDGAPLSDQELRDELVTLVATGYETTATALAWAFYWIHQNPAVRQSLVSHLVSLGHDPDPSVFAKSEYLTALCQEVLRLHPVIPLVARQVQYPFEVQGFTITKGTTVAACIYLTHHRADLYPEPEHFRPERFMNHDYSAYEYLPFGGGARRCIGMPLAMYEMKVVLGTVLSRFRLRLKSEAPVTPARRSVTVVPFGGVPMIVEEAMVG